MQNFTVFEQLDSKLYPRKPKLCPLITGVNANCARTRWSRMFRFASNESPWFDLPPCEISSRTNRTNPNGDIALLVLFSTCCEIVFPAFGLIARDLLNADCCGLFQMKAHPLFYMSVNFCRYQTRGFKTVAVFVRLFLFEHLDYLPLFRAHIEISRELNALACSGFLHLNSHELTKQHVKLRCIQTHRSKVISENGKVVSPL